MQWHLFLLSACLFRLVEASFSEIQVQSLQGRTAQDTILEIRRRLATFAKDSQSDVLFDNTTSLDNALIDETLFEYTYQKTANGTKGKEAETSAGFKISCSKCYIKGSARVKLTVNGSFNSTKVYNDVKTKAKAVFEEIGKYVHNVTDAIGGDLLNITDSLDHLPPPQINLNTDLDFPGYNLEVEFEGTELFVELSTVVSAGFTYSIPLYVSRDLGVALGPKLLLGAVFSFDLILSVDSQVDIKTGFHIKVDKKIAMKIALFAKESSHLQMHGGKFEFLPVTVESDGVLLKALLRLQLRAGFSIPIVDGPLDKLPSVGAGIEARVYANVAEFGTNITSRIAASDKDQDCALQVIQDYKLAVGAAAGATVELFGNTFGPTPATEIPVYYTTLAAACIAKTSRRETITTTVVPKVTRRDDITYSTATTVTQITYRVNACKSEGLMNCPASLQTLSSNVVTKTLTTTVPVGSKVDWSAPSVTAFAAETFGKGTLPLNSVNGKPVSYVPTTSTSTTPTTGPSSSPTSGVLEGETAGVSNKLIIGVAVGVGVPVFLAILGASIFALRRRFRRAELAPTADTQFAESSSKKQGTTVEYKAVPQDW